MALALLPLAACDDVAHPTDRTATAAPAPSPTESAAWWRTTFPPSLAHAVAPEVRYDPARVFDCADCGGVDGVVVDENGAYVYGFATDPTTGGTARGVVIVDRGRRVSPLVPLFRPRADLVHHTGNRALMNAGWAFWLAPSRLQPGEHALEVHALLADDRFGRLGNRATFRWPPPGPE